MNREETGDEPKKLSNLSDDDFIDDDYKGVNLIRVNLSEADLSGTNLRGTKKGDTLSSCQSSETE